MTISNELFTCDMCADEFTEEEVFHMYSNDFYCEDCYEEQEAFECPECREHYVYDDGIHSEDTGNMYCEDCIENEHTWCEKCETYGLHEEGATDAHGTFYCNECSDTLINCDHCDELHQRDDTYSDGNISLCTACLEDNYYSCSSCSDFVHTSRVQCDEYDDPYCYYCYQPITGTVHNYSYKPDPYFHHTRDDMNKPNLPYYGIELELEGDTSAENVRALLESLNGSLDNEDHAYLKKDCTCSVEVVSHPMSFQYHKKRMGWAEFLETCREHGFISHNAPQCGIHVHVSKSAFLDDNHIALFTYLFEYYYQQVKQITRRKQRQIDNWCMNYDIGDFETPRDLLRRAINTNIIRRSSILNFGDKTIEVRAFRGTLIHNSFIACLELVDAFFHISMIFKDYANHNRALEGITWKDITHYVASSNYNELHQFITRKGVE